MPHRHHGAGSRLAVIDEAGLQRFAGAERLAGELADPGIGGAQGLAQIVLHRLGIEGPQPAAEGQHIQLVRKDSSTLFISGAKP